MVAIKDGLESSTVSLLIFIDTASPSAVTNLVVSQYGSDIELSWSASTDSVLVTQYEVGRSIDSGPTIFQGFVFDTDFTDSDGLIGEIYYYVTAGDDAGNESTTESVHIDNEDPNPPTGLAYDAVTDAIHWTASTSSDVAGYDIYEEDDGYEHSVSATSYVTSFCDANYYVVTYDDFGNESTSTAFVFVTC